MRQLLESSNYSVRDLHQKLAEAGSSISYPALAAYKNYYSVPPFDRARTILNVFEYDIPDTALAEVLQYSREELKSLREDNYEVIQQGLRIQAYQFGGSLNAVQIRDLIDERIAELFDDNGNFNSYVLYLIKNDLIESGYLTPEK